MVSLSGDIKKKDLKVISRFSRLIHMRTFTLEDEISMDVYPWFSNLPVPGLDKLNSEAVFLVPRTETNPEDIVSYFIDILHAGVIQFAQMNKKDILVYGTGITTYPLATKSVTSKEDMKRQVDFYSFLSESYPFLTERSDDYESDVFSVVEVKNPLNIPYAINRALVHYKETWEAEHQNEIAALGKIMEERRRSHFSRLNTDGIRRRVTNKVTTAFYGAENTFLKLASEAMTPDIRRDIYQIKKSHNRGELHIESFLNPSLPNTSIIAMHGWIGNEKE